MGPEMSRENLIRDLERLRSEIDTVARNNPEASHKLNALISALEEKVAGVEEDDSGLVEQVQDEITRFEASHPRATAILNDILVTLSNMGI